MIPFALSLAAYAALRPPVAAGEAEPTTWPTIAGRRVIDSSFSSAGIGLDDDGPRVLISVVEGGMAPPGGNNRRAPDETLSSKAARAWAVLSVVTEIVVREAADDGIVVGIAGSDRESEAWLYLLDHQIDVALRRSPLLAALSPYGITASATISDFRGADDRRLAAHRTDYTVSLVDPLDRDEWPEIGEPGPASLMTLIGLLPAGCEERALLETMAGYCATPASGYDPTVVTLAIGAVLGDHATADLTVTATLDPAVEPVPEAEEIATDYSGPPENDDTEPDVLRPASKAGYPPATKI